MPTKTIRFSVKGEGGHIHVVRAVISPRVMSMSCSCGEEGVAFLCPHAERLLDGDAGIILSRNTDELDELIDAAWTRDFGRWLSICREYSGRTESARAHLAEANALRERVAHAGLIPQPPPWQVEPAPLPYREWRPSPR